MAGRVDYRAGASFASRSTPSAGRRDASRGHPSRGVSGERWTVGMASGARMAVTATVAASPANRRLRLRSAPNQPYWSPRRSTAQDSWSNGVRRSLREGEDPGPNGSFAKPAACVTPSAPRRLRLQQKTRPARRRRPGSSSHGFPPVQSRADPGAGQKRPPVRFQGIGRAGTRTGSGGASSRRTLRHQLDRIGTGELLPTTPATKRPPRISPRASIRRKGRSRSRHGGARVSRAARSRQTTPQRPGAGGRSGPPAPRGGGRASFVVIRRAPSRRFRRTPRSTGRRGRPARPARPHGAGSPVSSRAHRPAAWRGRAPGPRPSPRRRWDSTSARRLS